MIKNNKFAIGIVAAVLVLCSSARAGRMLVESTARDTVATDTPAPESSVIDEVIWVVGDEPILKSDVESTRIQGEANGAQFKGDPEFTIPEQIAVQKLFLHQAAIDSLEVTESEVASGIDDQINYWVNLIGSREKLEEYRGMTISQLRQQMHDDFKNQRLEQKMREKLVEDVSVTPADVRAYFNKLPEDSIPFVPTEVEVEIITRQAKITPEEINRVKEQLRNFTERVTNGSSSFATLARLYSEDPGSARDGGELGYMGRGVLDPAFASAAFNLTDPKKISKIVESEFGYHIIQLIDKRGDKVNCRHILLKPKVSQEAIDTEILRLDSLADDIRAGKFSFEEAATFVSDDKDTKNNHGIMVNSSYNQRTSRFQMKDLPKEVAAAVEKLQVGEVSNAFAMVNDKGKTQVAIVKLKSRVDGHKATITGDFQVMKDIVEEKEKEKVLHNWVVDKIKRTYVRMKDRYKNYPYEYEGWVK